MSDSGRDLQFEIQYLLSLTLVVFGILSVYTIRSKINDWVGYVVVLLLAAHFSVFIIAYGFGHGTHLSIDFADTMNDYSWPILIAIAVSFVFFVIHTALGVIYLHITGEVGFTSTLGEMVIKYIVPTILTGAMVFVSKRKGYDPIAKFEDINVKVIPDFIRVYHDASETKPLTVKIENLSSDDFDYDLTVKIPQGVSLHQDTQTYDEEFTDSGTVTSGHQTRFSFEISHESSRRVSETITVDIESDGAKDRREVQLELFA